MAKMTLRSGRRWVLGAAGVLVLLARLLGQESAAPRTRGPTFPADFTFTGSSLGAWRTLGQASWRAQNGEIVGTPSHPGGGWLVLDK